MAGVGGYNWMRGGGGVVFQNRLGCNRESESWEALFGKSLIQGWGEGISW